MGEPEVQCALKAGDILSYRKPYTKEQLAKIAWHVGANELALHLINEAASIFINSSLSEGKKYDNEDIKKILAAKPEADCESQIKASYEYIKTLTLLTSKQKKTANRNITKVNDYCEKIVSSFARIIQNPLTVNSLSDNDRARLYLLSNLAHTIVKTPLTNISSRVPDFEYPALRSLIWQLATIFYFVTNKNPRLSSAEDFDEGDPEDTRWRGTFFKFLWDCVSPLEPISHPTKNELGDYASNVIADWRRQNLP